MLSLCSQVPYINAEINKRSYPSRLIVIILMVEYLYGKTQFLAHKPLQLISEGHDVKPVCESQVLLDCCVEEIRALQITEKP